MAMFNLNTTASRAKPGDSDNFELGEEQDQVLSNKNIWNHYQQMELILGRRGFRDIELAGKGGSATVVSALKGDSKVALKSSISMPYSSRKQSPLEVLEAEAKNLEFLHDKNVPNIVGFNGLDYAFFDGFYGGFLELELCDRSAFDGRAYNPSQLVKHAVDAAESLVQIHDSGLVHGDIKPANILVNGSGEVRLIDLATAREPSKEYQHSPLSPGYLAPELFNSLDRTRTGDVFSLAATVYNAVTGHGIRNEYGDIFRSPPRPSLLNRRISDELDHAITRGLEFYDRPDLEDFSELLQETPEYSSD
jgi:serine/threonine protein kinase